jgi:3-hydroxyacyl-CoA dehydrogenase
MKALRSRAASLATICIGHNFVGLHHGRSVDPMPLLSVFTLSSTQDGCRATAVSWLGSMAAKLHQISVGPGPTVGM